MSTTNYSGDYELVNPDGTSENEKRETAVRELFDENQLDDSLTKDKLRWLYHWFSFNRDHDILLQVQLRLILFFRQKESRLNGLWSSGGIYRSIQL